MTVEPLSLFGEPPTPELDVVEARRRQVDAIERAEANADPAWLERAEAILRAMPVGTLFTTDDVWVTLLAEGVETHEPRALGGVTRRLQTEGVIVNTRDYRPSQRPKNHGRPVPVWRRCEPLV